MTRGADAPDTLFFTRAPDRDRMGHFVVRDFPALESWTESIMRRKGKKMTQNAFWQLLRTIRGRTTILKARDTYYLKIDIIVHNVELEMPGEIYYSFERRKYVIRGRGTVTEPWLRFLRNTSSRIGHFVQGVRLAWSSRGNSYDAVVKIRVQADADQTRVITEDIQDRRSLRSSGTELQRPKVSQEFRDGPKNEASQQRRTN